MNLKAIGLIVSTINGVFRVKPNGDKELLIGKLPPISQEALTAQSLIPSNGKYPDTETLLKRAEEQRLRGLGAVTRR